MKRSMADNMSEKIDPKWPAQIRAVSQRAATLFTTFSVKRADYNRSAADYLPAVRNLVAKDFAPDLHSLAGEVAKAKTALENDKAALTARAVAPDATRTPSLSAEIRQYLRSCSYEDRVALLLGPKASKQAIQSALEAPCFLSGLAPDFVETVRTVFLQREFPADVAALAETADAITHAEGSIGVLHVALADETGFKKREEFNAWLETAAPPKPVDTREADEAARLAELETRLANLAA